LEGNSVLIDTRLQRHFSNLFSLAGCEPNVKYEKAVWNGGPPQN